MSTAINAARNWILAYTDRILSLIASVFSHMQGPSRVAAAKTPLFRKPQNSTLSANWICRGFPCVVVICPAPPSGDSENGPRSFEAPANIPADGGPKFGWFMMLKNSARNCNIPPSPRNPNFVSFTKEKSQFLEGGPGMISRPEVPNWPIVQNPAG